MKLLADKVGEYVLAPGVFPPIEGIDKVKVVPIRELSDKEIGSWARSSAKIFSARKPIAASGSGGDHTLPDRNRPVPGVFSAGEAMEIRIRGLTRDYTRKASASGLWTTSTSPYPPTGIFTLLGPSGCGPTTLLRCIVGLETPRGRDRHWGQIVWSGKRGSAPAGTGDWAWFPDVRDLAASWTVFENVAYPLKCRTFR